MSNENSDHFLSIENVAVSASDPKQWMIAGEIHEKHGEFEKALLCFVAALKAASANSDDNAVDVIASTGKRILSNGSSLVSKPSESFLKQDLLTQLYALGCALHRHPNLSAAIGVLEAAVEIYSFNLQRQNEEMLNTDEILLTKIYYELAWCREGKQQLDQCIVDYRTSLILAVHNNDISHEKMVLLRFCNVLLETEGYVEAADGYVKLLALKSDIKKTLNDDMLIFKAHWTVECECEIRYGLCVAYKALHMYDRALEEGLKFKELLKTLPDVKLSKPRLRNHEGITHMMQINSILGGIYESTCDLNSSLLTYQEWLEESKSIASTNQGSAMVNEVVTAYESVGRVHLKLKNYKLAHNCFDKLVKLGQASSSPTLEINGIILQGEVQLAKKDCEGARPLFNQALKLSQATADDSYFMECRCMAKEAEVLALERRYAHALYRCEQALNLGKKSEKSFSLLDIERQAAIYSQHSTSEKELFVALRFLYDEIIDLEVKLQRFKSEGVSWMRNEEQILYRDYTAVQVILHRIGENKLSLAFGEALKGRGFARAKNQAPRIPRVELKGITQKKLDSEDACLVEADQLLPIAANQTIISYTLTDAGLLAHIYNPERNLTYSYLSSDHVVEPHLVEVSLTETVDSLFRDRSFPAEKLQLMYNTENRCIPGSSSNAKYFLPSILKQKAKQVDSMGDGAGDSVSSNKIRMDKSGECRDEKGETGTAKQKEVDPLKELYKMLIQPLENTLHLLPEQSYISITVDGLLAKIPFDHLINPIDGKAFGRKFNVISTPCLRHFETCFSSEKNLTQNKPDLCRHDQLRQTFDDPEDLLILEEVGMEKKFTGLVSSTASGTNIISSSQYMAPYKQVAEYLDVFPVVGCHATKSEFLKQMSESSLIHVATYGSMHEGFLAFRPDDFPLEEEPLSADRYLVTLKDLLDLPSCAVKLVVLSSGQSWTSKPFSTPTKLNLPNAFLAAGAQAVVFPLWSVPDSVSETFYFHFYRNLQTGAEVSRALYEAKVATKQKHPDPMLWNAFSAVGNDVIINLSEIRGAEVHRAISGVESNILSASSLVEPETSAFKSYFFVQKCISRIAGHLDVSRDGDVIPFLLGLLEEATDRLTKDENTDRPVIILPEAVEAVEGITDLLKLVGFDFQNVSLSSLPLATRSSFSRNKQKDAKMIVFPHWNQDNLLLPVHQALTGLHELCESTEALRALSLLLPTTEDILCKLIDLLAMLHHTPHVQLHTTDHSVSAVWGSRRVRQFLFSIGLTNIRSLLVFYKTIENKCLLMSTLQLLVAVCEHRNGSILEELHVQTLGRIPSEVERPAKILKSFSAVLMPRNEILVTSSWLGGDGHVDEGGDRKSLAVDINDVTVKYNRVLDHAKWWHQDVKIPKQPSQNLPSVEEERITSPRKVKVQSGASPSCNRIPVESVSESSASLYDVLRRREEARNVLHKRCVDIKQRQASALRSSYLPFVKTGRK